MKIYYRIERISDHKIVTELNTLAAARSFMKWHLKILNIKHHHHYHMVEVTEKELWVGMPPALKKK